MKIANKNIGAGSTFVIGEIGNNHNGDLQLALKLIDAAVDAGADCVKFQMRDMASVYRQKTLKKNAEDLGTEYILDLLNKFQLSDEEHGEVIRYCEAKEIMYLCTPWDLVSLSTLEQFNIPAYKVASADLTNMQLLAALAATKKPLIISTGMSLESEILNTVAFLNSRNVEFVLLHCNSTYPAPFDDINLKWLSQLSKIHSFFGYSGHERGIAVSLAAVGLGAQVVERHLTFDRNMEGPDHAASLEPEEFKSLVQGIREIEKALGNGGVRSISQGEMINRENLTKSLVAACDLELGTVISAEHIKVRSPGQGLSPQYFDELLGHKLSRQMESEDYFYPSDLFKNKTEPKQYCFNRPWGIPVRYHDFNLFDSRIKPDIFEFHLSYSDLDLDLGDFLSGQYKSGFVVHAPELFSNSKLMDLATPDTAYRYDSIKETQRVIDITRKLKKYFPKTQRPMIVANIGGFTMDAPLPTSELTNYYEQFADSLSKLDMEGVELIPQTMAPFPWHFGGQRFQNLFLLPEQIIDWCKKLDLRMCFDVSHSRLMCNHFQLDFYKFSEQIAPITAHLHLGDASGINGEGLQVDDGDIDFDRLGSILNEFCPQASFIPEIWQGHKNGGEGFWIALDKLEKYLK